MEEKQLQKTAYIHVVEIFEKFSHLKIKFLQKTSGLYTNIISIKSSLLYKCQKKAE